MRTFPRLTPLSILCCLLLVLFHGPALAACVPVDFLKTDIPSSRDDAERQALRLAYPGVSFSPDGTMLSINGSPPIPFGDARNISPEERLRDPTIREQFTYIYPLDFDLSLRTTPWYDPGRVRNDAFFRALYAATQEAARQSLVRVQDPLLAGAAVLMTRQNNVACQLAAALSLLRSSGEDHSAAFRSPGGGFNWREISGTSRLSAHSFGIAFDINPEIGQYWQWTGARAGEVGAYENRVPRKVVETMERFGFIWGGKWHHFDGMHFEFRPELILYSRILSRTP